MKKRQVLEGTGKSLQEEYDNDTEPNDKEGKKKVQSS